MRNPNYLKAFADYEAGEFEHSEAVPRPEQDSEYAPACKPELHTF
jgi:hypothetical protein